MKISIFGLGYVGCVTAASLADAGHEVIGIEVNPEKVDLLRSGRVPFVEPGLTDLLLAQVSCGRLAFESDSTGPTPLGEISLLCVGTPSLPTGQLDTSAVEAVCRRVASSLREAELRSIIVIRSTVLPGTAERCTELIETISGKKSPRDFAVVSNPEFMREGCALKDFREPPFTVIGADRREDARSVARLYSHLQAPLFLTDLGTAQMVKYASNLFHALKVVFGNEIARICKSTGADPHRVMEIFCADTKLNLSPYYLRPGFAYGGSCLPKDLRAILALARERHVPLPVLEQLENSNRLQIEQGIQLVLSTGCERVGVLGFSFKPNTDDLRESPHVALVEALLGKGRSVRIYDPYLQFKGLMGANRRFIERAVPHIVSLLVDSLDEIAASSDCIVIANRDPEFRPILEFLRPKQVIVDLVGAGEEWKSLEHYRGLSW